MAYLWHDCGEAHQEPCQLLEPNPDSKKKLSRKGAKDKANLELPNCRRAVVKDTWSWPLRDKGFAAAVAETDSVFAGERGP